MKDLRGILWMVLFLGILLPGCLAAVPQPTSTPAASELSLVEQAALEATRIVQKAQATALVLQARAQASALINQAGVATPVLQPTTPADNAATASAPTPAPDQTRAAPIQVEVLNVGFAAEGGMLIVRFMAPAKEAEKWWQGSAQVIQESTQQVYEQIPVMPIIGPLIGRPKQDGQAGYVMLYHDPALLQPGDLLTVILGNHKFEHVEFGK